MNKLSTNKCEMEIMRRIKLKRKSAKVVDVKVLSIKEAMESLCHMNDEPVRFDVEDRQRTFIEAMRIYQKHRPKYVTDYLIQWFDDRRVTELIDNKYFIANISIYDSIKRYVIVKFSDGYYDLDTIKGTDGKDASFESIIDAVVYYLRNVEV